MTTHPDKEDLDLVHYLMKKGYNPKGDVDWAKTVETTITECKANKEVFTVNKNRGTKILQGNVKDWIDIAGILSNMIKSKQTNPEVVNQVKSSLLSNAGINFHIDMATIFRQIAILSPKKDVELIKKLEPQFLAHLDSMQQFHFESILKGFKLWNYISEPIYAKLIKTSIESPDKLGVERLVYLMHILEVQGVYNTKFVAEAQKYINTELKNAWELPDKELIIKFPTSTAGMYIRFLLRLKILNMNTLKLVETIVLKYIHLNKDTKALCNLLSSHAAWIQDKLAEDKSRYHKNKDWKAHSEDFLGKVVVHALELKDKLGGEEIMSIITNATIGGIKKKDHAITVLKLASEGFKKLQLREEYGNEEDMKKRQVILEMNLYSMAKKYCCNKLKRDMLREMIKNTEIKHFNEP